MITPAFRQKLFEHVIGRTAWAMPTLYAALLTEIPGFAWIDNSEPVSAQPNGGEAGYVGYRRALVPATFWGSVVQSSGEASVTNTTGVAFPTAQGGFASVHRIAFFDALTGGNMLFIADTQILRQIGVNVRPRAAPGQLSIEVSGFGTEHFRQKVLEHAIGRTAWTMPALHAALYSTAPGDNGTGGTEASYGSYARVAVPQTAWEAVGAGIAGDEYSVAAIEWPECTSGSNTIAATCLTDASSGGNVLLRPDTSGVPLAVGVGDIPKINAGFIRFFG